MMQKDVSGADRLEEVLAVPERRDVDRAKGRVFVLGQIFAAGERGHGVEHERGLGRVDVELRIQLELITKPLDRLAGRLAGDLETYGLTALSLPELGLDREEQVLALVFVDVDVEVTCDAEGEVAEQRLVREEARSLAEDDLFEGHEGRAHVRHRDRDQARQARGKLDDAEGGFGSIALLKAETDVDVLVAQVGERVRRVDGDRRQDREDVRLEGRRQRAHSLRGELVRRDSSEPGSAERRVDLVQPDRRVRLAEVMGSARDEGELRFGGQSVGGLFRDVAVALGLEPRDAHHEELIEVRGEDREEL